MQSKKRTNRTNEVRFRARLRRQAATINQLKAEVAKLKQIIEIMTIERHDVE